MIPGEKILMPMAFFHEKDHLFPLKGSLMKSCSICICWAYLEFLELEALFPTVSSGAGSPDCCTALTGNEVSLVLGCCCSLLLPCELDCQASSPGSGLSTQQKEPSHSCPGESCQGGLESVGAASWPEQQQALNAGEAGSGDSPQFGAEETQKQRCEAVRRWWTGGHCYPACTFPNTSLCRLLIAEMKKFHTDVYNQLQSLEILQNVC